MTELAVYEPGKHYLKTVIIDDKVLYSNLSVDEYKKTLEPHILIIPLDEARAMIRQALDELCGTWKKISKKQFIEALECLPPEKWHNKQEIEIFRSCEYYTSNITSHYVRYKGRFFTALRRTTTTYDQITREIKEIK